VALRVAALRRNCDTSIETLRALLEMEISKLTPPILALTMGEFLGEYEGNPLRYFERQQTMAVAGPVVVDVGGAARRPVRRRYRTTEKPAYPTSRAAWD
jgi:hypothetical protein